MSPVQLTEAVSSLTEATFAREVLGSELPVLVDFWAQWCPPCKMIAPVLAQIAEERAGSLAIRSINADENPTVARDYQIMSLPTLLLFVGGEPIRAWVGARPKAKLVAELDAALHP